MTGTVPPMAGLRRVEKGGAAPPTGRFPQSAGATSTEIAVLMPAVIALVLVSFQMGLWWHARQVASAAAEEAVEAAQAPDGSEVAGEEAAWSLLGRAGNLTDPQVLVTRDSGVASARVTGSVPRLVPGLSWTISAEAAGPVEAFIPEPDR